MKRLATYTETKNIDYINKHKDEWLDYTYRMMTDYWTNLVDFLCERAIFVEEIPQTDKQKILDFVAEHIRNKSKYDLIMCIEGFTNMISGAIERRDLNKLFRTDFNDVINNKVIPEIQEEVSKHLDEVEYV